MLKEDYKKEYDKLHPSKELIAKTKQRALENYKATAEEEIDDKRLVEEMEQEAELELFAVDKRKRYYQIASGLAAGIAIFVVSSYMWGGTSQKGQKPSQVACVPEITELEQTPEPTHKDKKDKKKEDKHQEIHGERQLVANVSSNEKSNWAKMDRSQGVSLDYADSQKVILHGNFGIVVYDLSSKSISQHIGTKEYATSESIVVNEDGSKILWYLNDTEYAEVYDLATKKVEKVLLNNGQWEEAAFCSVTSVAGSQVDIYNASSAAGEMIAIGGGQYVQLMYQAPASTKQASLGISIVSPDIPNETIHFVFGSTGEKEIEKEGITVGGYYNELGKQLFGKEEAKNEENVEITEAPEGQELGETEVPTESMVPDPTVEVNVAEPETSSEKELEVEPIFTTTEPEQEAPAQ